MDNKLTIHYDNFFNTNINQFLVVLQNWVNNDVKQDSLICSLQQNKFILYIKSTKKGFKMIISYTKVDIQDVFINTKSVSKFRTNKELHSFLQKNKSIKYDITIKSQMNYLIDKRDDYLLLIIKTQPKQFYTINQLHYLKIIKDEYLESLSYIEKNFNNLKHENFLNMLVIKVNTEGLQKQYFQPCYANFLIKYKDVKIRRGVIKLNDEKVMNKMFYRIRTLKIYTLNEFIQYIQFLHKNLPLDIALINNRMSLHDYYIINCLQTQLSVSRLYYGITPPTGVYKGIGLEVEKPSRLHIIKPGSIELMLQGNAIQKIVLQKFSYFNHLITQEIDVQDLLIKRDIIDENYNARNIVMNNLEYQMHDLNICYKGYDVLEYNKKSFKVQNIVTTDFLKSLIYYFNNNIQNYPIIIEEEDKYSHIDYELVDNELQLKIKEYDNNITIGIRVDKQDIY